MIVIKFGKWHCSANEKHVYDRVYFRRRWTPLARRRKRYKPAEQAGPPEPPEETPNYYRFLD